MARLIAALIRHGDYQQLAHTPSAHQPFPLTDQGRRQAQQATLSLWEMIGKHHWQISSQIDSSQLLRAWQTATLIGEQLKDCGGKTLQVACFDELAERSVGSAANLTLQQIEEIIRLDPRFPDCPDNWKSDSHYRLPLQGAESLMQAGERVARHLQNRMESLSAGVREDTLKLFVGHGAAFRHAAFQLGVLRFEQIALLSMYHARPVYLQYDAARNQWTHIAGEWKIRVKTDEQID